jgi:hypothetical protein
MCMFWSHAVAGVAEMRQGAPPVNRQGQASPTGLEAMPACGGERTSDALSRTSISLKEFSTTQHKRSACDIAQRTRPGVPAAVCRVHWDCQGRALKW